MDGLVGGSRSHSQRGIGVCRRSAEDVRTCKYTGRVIRGDSSQLALARCDERVRFQRDEQEGLTMRWFPKEILENLATSLADARFVEGGSSTGACACVLGSFRSIGGGELVVNHCEFGTAGGVSEEAAAKEPNRSHTRE